jgi:iron complex outermembrane receptor protein
VSGNWDGKLQLNWKPNDGVLAYAGVSRGTKAGGFNGGALAFYTVEQAIFRDEELTDYEVGTKIKFAEGRVRLNASGYYYDYVHMQVFNQLGFSTVTFNDDGTIYGAELDLQAQIAEGLEGQLGVSLLRTHLDPIANVNIITGALVYSSEELPNSPHETVDARVVKSWALGPGHFALEADGRWVGEHKLNLIDNPATDEAAHFTMDARLSYGFADRRWEIAAYARNLTDEQYRVAAAPFAGTNGAVIQIFAPPRTIGGSVRFNFQ